LDDDRQEVETLWRKLRPAERYVVGGGLVLVLIGLACVFILANFPLRNFGTDFAAYLQGGYRLAQGQDPYFRQIPPPGTEDIYPYLTRYLYPPVSLIWMLPFTHLSALTAGIIWTLLSLLVYWATVAFAAWKIKARYKLRDPVVAALVLPWFFVYPVLHHLSVGQSDIFVFGLAAVFLWRFRTSPLVAGACLAIACWWKIYPVFLIPLVLAAEPKGAIRATAYTAVFGLTLAGVGLLICPPDYWRSWLEVVNFKSTFGNTYIANQSLIATFQRLFDPRLARQPLLFASAGLSKAAIAMGPVVSLAAIVAAVRLVAPAQRKEPLVLLALFGVLYPLGATYWWVQQLVWLAPAAMLVVAHYSNSGDRPQWPLIAIGAAVLLLLIPWTTPTTGIGDWSFATVLFRHRMLFAHLLVLAGLVYSLTGRQNR
jgi:Glycosyltransferase family 87